MKNGNLCYTVWMTNGERVAELEARKQSNEAQLAELGAHPGRSAGRQEGLAYKRNFPGLARDRGRVAAQAERLVLTDQAGSGQTTRPPLGAIAPA